MPFFWPLPLTVPRRAYSVIHQRLPSVPEDEYVKTLLELTRQAAGRAAGTSRQINAWRKAQLEEAMKGVPPATAANVGSWLDGICPLPAVEEALELATVEAQLPEGRLQHLAAAGREYLIQELGRVIFFTQNQVATFGDPIGSGPHEWQPTLFFAKGKPRYDEFRSALGRAMERAVKAAGLRAISLWQRRLGMGQIFEWELRLRGEADRQQLTRALDAIAEEGCAVAERVASRGRLLVYQRID